MKLNVELDEDDFVKLLEAVGVAYHRREHVGDVEGTRQYRDLDKRVRGAVEQARRNAKQSA